MIHEQSVRAMLESHSNGDTPLPMQSGRCRVALEQLHKAFAARRPLAILAGHWASDTDFIFRKFVTGLGSDVTAIRIGKTCPGALEGMRQVIRATGYEPRDMDHDELNFMLAKFLAFQRSRQLRTVIIIEESPNNHRWVRDTVRGLVVLESENKFGLMTVLCRQSKRNAARARDADQPPPRTADQLPRLLRLTPMVQPSGAEVGSMSIDEEAEPHKNGSAALRMILTHNGETMRDITMQRPRMMIGRARDNDICIDDNSISRHHALLVRFGATAFVTDLNSTAGSFINSHRIRDHLVIHQDILSIGNHRIKFIAPDMG